MLMVGREGQMKDSSSVALISVLPGLLLLHATNHNISALYTPTHPLQINPRKPFTSLKLLSGMLSGAHFLTACPIQCVT